MKPKQIHLGVIVMTCIPELGGWVAICQQRNAFNSESESGYKSQSFPGAYQTTFNEKGEEGEAEENILYRGACEELGEVAGRCVAKAKPLSKLLYREEDDEKNLVVYRAILPPTILKSIRTEVSATIKLVTESQLAAIQELTGDDKSREVTQGVIKMFPSAIKAMRKAFECTKYNL